METSTKNSWELSMRLIEYLQRYMGHHLLDNNIKDRILGNKSIPFNIKKTPIIDNFIKELLVENRKEISLMMKML